MQRFVAAHDRLLPLPIADWDLDRLTLAAFYFHPDLDVARAEAAVARAATVTAGQRPNPTLTVPIEHKGEAALSPWVVVLGIDVPIETAGKRGFRIREATAQARAADLAIAQNAWRIRSAIRAQLAVLTAANDAAAILQRQVDIQNDLVEALQKRLQVGETSTLEVTRVRIAASQTELLLRDRESQGAQARARLAAAIGVPEGGLAAANLVFDPFEIETAAGIRELQKRALVARPDILMSLAEYAGAEAALRLELARQYPNLEIGPGFGWDQGNQRWDLGFASSLPILSRNRGPIAEAEARRSASEARLIALQARIIAAIDESSATYQSSLVKLNETDRVVEFEKRQAQAAEESFGAGQIDRIVLRTAQWELETAQLAQVDTLAEVQQALGTLEDAVEQPLSGKELPEVPSANPREVRR